MNPNVGDIWEWTVERYDAKVGTYYEASQTILILTEPEIDRHGYSWGFDALVLDGEDAGVVQEWVMALTDQDGQRWRQLA